MSRISIGFALKGVKHLEMRNGKLDSRSDFDSFLSSCGIEAYFGVETHFGEMKMYEIKGTLVSTYK